LLIVALSDQFKLEPNWLLPFYSLTDLVMIIFIHRKHGSSKNSKCN